MLRQLRKNKQAQNTAEYALMIALVIGAYVAMQKYGERAINAKVKDVSNYLAASGNSVLNQSTVQYDPYYSRSDSNTEVSSGKNTRYAEGVTAGDEFRNVTRNQTENEIYSGATTGL